MPNFKLSKLTIPSTTSILLLTASNSQLNATPSVEKNNSDEDEKTQPSQPPIIPFDFAREYIIVPPKKEKEPSQKPLLEVPEVLKRATSVISDYDNDRPTGYDNKDEDDDDNWVPSTDASPVSRFLADFVFDSPYDSPQRRDAKFVVKSVTFLSFAIGVIFTVTFYAFPGKFISYQANTDFAARYSNTYTDPNNLLGGDNGTPPSGSSYGEFFDDAVGLPVREETRFAIPTTRTQAPGRSESL